MGKSCTDLDVVSQENDSKMPGQREIVPDLFQGRICLGRNYVTTFCKEYSVYPPNHRFFNPSFPKMGRPERVVVTRYLSFILGDVSVSD